MWQQRQNLSGTENHVKYMGMPKSIQTVYIPINYLHYEKSESYSFVTFYGRNLRNLYRF